MRVLIVEDRPAEAETLADLVAHQGHQPMVAAGAQAALRKFVDSRLPRSA